MLTLAWQGDVIHVSALGQHMIVLNSLEAITDVMQKRAHSISGRPYLPMLGELFVHSFPALDASHLINCCLPRVGWGFSTTLLEYGQLWKKHRRSFHQHFRVHTTTLFLNTQALESYKMVFKLLETPHDFRKHIRKSVLLVLYRSLIQLLLSWAAAAIIKVTYGLDVHDTNDPLLSLVQAATESFEDASTPGRYLVDNIPIRTFILHCAYFKILTTSLVKYVPSWLPGAGFKVKAERWRSNVQQAIEIPFQAAKDALVSKHSYSVPGKMLQPGLFVSTLGCGEHGDVVCSARAE